MASIQSLGIGSGLLTTELVENIVSAEREATDLRLGARRAEYEARISAFGAVRSSLESLRSAVSTLSDSNGLLGKVANSANEAVVSATVDNSAATGVHTVEVLALARAHSLVTQSYDDPNAVVGEGTLDIRFGTTTFSGGNYDTFTENPDRAGGSISIDSSNNTLSGLRDAINDAGLGVDAALVNDGSGYRLVLTSSETGENNSMEITVTETGDPGLSALAFNAGAAISGSNLTQTVVAEDASVTINGINVTRENNSVSEVVQGVTFDVRALNVGTPVTVAVADDNDGLKDNMQTFVDAFNDVKALSDELTAFDEDEAAGSILTGDSVLRGVSVQLRRFLSGTLSGLGSSSIRSLVELGLTTNQNANFILEFDASTFQSTLDSASEDVVTLLADRSSATDESISFTNFQSATAAGSYAVDISQVATQGFVAGATVAGLASGVTIDDDNDGLTVKVDGVSTGPLSLSQGVYADGDALAAEVERAINADSAIQASGRSVSVAFNSDDERLEITSARFGSSSRVEVTAVDGNSLSQLGIDLDDGSATAGLDVEGTINGVDATGSGQFLSVPLGPQPATAGFYRGAEGLTFPTTLDSSNNNFSVAIDGISSGTITLTEAEYTSGADLAAEIQTQINADTALTASGKSIAVAFDGVNGRFTLTSGSTGRSSSVSVSSIAAGVEAALGLTAGAGEAGKAAGRSDDPAGGIQIRVSGGETGPRGEVTLVRGIMNQLDRYLDSTLSFGGSIDAKLSTLEELLSEVDAEEQRFDTRINNLEERLRTQFAAADALISQLNSTSSFLESQLAALPTIGSRE